MFETYEFFFLVGTVIATSTLSGVVGMAGGIVLLSVMTFFFPFQALIPIHGTTQLASNFSRTWMLRSHVDKGILKAFAFGAPIGSVLGVVVISRVIRETDAYLAIAALILLTLVAPKLKFKLKVPKKHFFWFGILLGAFALVIGAVGPIIAPFFYSQEIPRKSLVATKAAIQSIVHFLKIPSFLYLGFDFIGNIGIIATLSVAALIGTQIGVKLLGKISEEVFRRLFQVFLFLSAIRLIAKSQGWF